jgi:hypothetical protein
MGVHAGDSNRVVVGGEYSTVIYYNVSDSPWASTNCPTTRTCSTRLPY